MRTAWIAVSAAALFCGVFGARAADAGADVPAAFAKDGFEVVKSVEFGGWRGYKAVNPNVTLLSTGAPKAAFYAEGNATALGYLMGQLTFNETSVMLTTYVNHVVPSILDEKLDKELSNNPLTKGVYDELCAALGNRLVEDVENTWNAPGGSKDLVPPALVQEMEGLVAGAVAAGADPSVVTFGRVLTLNHGIDLLSAHLYTGHILDLFFNLTEQAVPHLSDEALRLGRRLFHPDSPTRQAMRPRAPAFCDAVAMPPMSGGGVGTRTFFGRDFQLSTGGVLQDLAAPVVLRPTDGRHALVGAGGPGFVGLMTIVNDAGVAMGVDTLRTGLGNISRPGLNSLLLVRAVGDSAGSTAEAVDIVADAVRGVSWLYPLADASGEAAILETGLWQDPSNKTVPDWTTLLSPTDPLRSLLPNASYLAAHSPVDFRNGIFVRWRNYSSTSYPAVASAVQSVFNPPLFAHAGVSYNASALADPQGLLFANFSTENAQWGEIASKYFSPVRWLSDGSGQDVLVLSNNALTPQLRVAQMGFWPSVVKGEAIEWRRDMLGRTARHELATNPQLDLNRFSEIISFLSPCHSTPPSQACDHGVCIDPKTGAYCTPNYWTDLLHPDDPMSAVIEGSIVAADLVSRTVRVRSGYFADGWLQLTLPAYL